jgi:hypothetical protein
MRKQPLITSPSNAVHQDSCKQLVCEPHERLIKSVDHQPRKRKFPKQCAKVYLDCGCILNEF